MTFSLVETTAREIAELPQRSLDDVRGLRDSELIELARLDAQFAQALQTRAALTAGEIARRSDAALGQDGLAQRSGFRTPIELIRVTTRSTARDASTAVRVGSLAQEDHPVAQALLDGQISVGAADAIVGGLGTASGEITDEILTDAAAALCGEASTLDVDRLFRRARELRNEIDAAGVLDREAARQAARSLRVFKLPDGMTRLTWMMDPETAAVVVDVLDRATSPRRGGPRFVEGSRAELAASIQADERSTEQLASDVFVQLLRSGADADSSQLLGTGAPVVNVIVTREVLTEGSGAAWIEGQADAVSVETAERLACTGASVDLTLDQHGNVLDLGREQRFYNRRQRRALAARDGGCRWPGCDRPPSWTEAHHIAYWGKDRGRTDLDNGILLCRHHHLLLHNQHWVILRDDDGYWLVPPAAVDASQAPRPMPAKGSWMPRTELAGGAGSAPATSR